MSVWTFCAAFLGVFVRGLFLYACRRSIVSESSVRRVYVRVRLGDAFLCVEFL